MKKVLSSIFMFFVFIYVSFAQVSVHPDDRFYQFAQNWEIKGYIESLPLIRPYPSPVIKDILETVINCPNKADAEIALEEFERIFSKSYFASVEGGLDLKNSVSETNGGSELSKNLLGRAGIAGELVFHPLVSFGYDFGFYGESADFFDVAPYYVNKKPDSLFDPADIGPIEMYIDWNANVSVGTKKTYATGGLSTTGYGPFLNDGLALNDSSFHSGNFIFNTTQKKWSYASSLQMLGASVNNPYYASNLTDGKYLAFHAFQYRFNSKFHFSFYENIIFGPKFNIAYVFPVPFMGIQNVTGASANLQMGLLLESVPVKGLKLAADIFVDDLAVNDVVKFNFDTKIRIAGQTGVIYSPDNSICTTISMNYQMVFPYTYAHWEYTGSETAQINASTINYQNYTNGGVCVGSVLDPNSDKFSFKAEFNPLPFFNFSFATNFIRHCNSAEAFGNDDAVKYILAREGQYATDGSINMHQMFENLESEGGTPVDQAWNSLGFMTSGHKMEIVQAGIKGEFHFPKTKFGRFSLSAGYTFEYVKNAGVNRNLYTGGKINWEKDESGYKVDGVSVTYEELYNLALKEAEKQKNEWIASLENKINHYFSVGFKYIY